MSKLQKPSTLTPFIDYIPAELKENKTWEIVYYAKDPSEPNPTKQLKRKRNRVKPMNNKTERRKYAKKIIAKINHDLERGWTPFINENNVKSYSKLKDVFKIFIQKIEQQIKKGNLRSDTLRAYKSYINNFNIFLSDNGKEDIFVNEFNESLCRDFLDVIYYDRENSATTHNNYLTFIGILTRWMIKRRYISVDFTPLISRIKQTEKRRTIIPKEIREEIFSYLNKNNTSYYTLCLTVFYCLIRRTEFTKLKVNDVYLANGIINIPSHVSKNGKSQIVTIPKELLHNLANHIRNSKNSDYLFSANNFKPGNIQLKPKKITDTWDKLRNTLCFEKSYQWYSLKDTGITNYLQLGIPTIDVKNQARHYSITQTEAYIPKNILKAVGNIQNANLNF
ncbi:site-specific integrase [Tenacibaculum sp. 47A_GOM-205m]|uniref:tyrosine-type recombinase/integrase n=1 Tax=Tenacibaculum sp. 47A_GOM-205m TaxID=1380384 RepID=UPI0004904B3C|nr:site-specific integrase [Tenacibaculum sp. 47A_GOM-205m]